MSERPPAPYPANTKAKGWRFELDYERIEQSGTWSSAMSLALDGYPLARPLLLAMWYSAWKQVPCGSLPADDDELAGAIGIPSSVFAEYRKVLLRGWWEADDGRLYHPTITARVLEMMSKRRSDADRQARRREAVDAAESGATSGDSQASHADVTRDTDASPAGVGRESDTDHRPPNTSLPPVERGTRSRAPSRPDDVPEAVWRDWTALRRSKRANVTETTLSGARAEAAKAGWSLADFLAEWVVRGSQGLKAEWLTPRANGTVRPFVGKQSALEAHNRSVGESFLAKRRAEHEA